MAETVLEDFKCAKCGSAVRAGSLFCFHCGAAIEPPNQNKSNVSDAWFKESIVEGQETAVRAEPETKEETVSAVAQEVKATENVEAKIEKDADLNKLKSAASMRDKPKSVGKKTVEVVWEEPEGSTIAWFVVAVIIFFAISAGLIFAAWYLK